MARLNLEQLKSFLTVARLGSISKAANAQNLTQPAVTSRLKALEDSLRTELFQRTSYGIVLTKRGDMLVRYAQEIEQVSDSIYSAIMNPEGIEGQLRLGVSETVAQSWLPNFISAIHESFPGIDIEIQVDNSMNLREALLNCEIDLAVMLGPVSDVAVNNIELPDVKLVWYCSVDCYAECSVNKNFFERPIITFARNTRPYHELKSELLNRIGPGISFFSSSSLSACFRMTEDGLGVAALPKIIGQKLVNENKLVEFNPGWELNPLKFTASYIDEPPSYLVESAANLALQVAKKFHKI